MRALLVLTVVSTLAALCALPLASASPETCMEQHDLAAHVECAVDNVRGCTERPTIWSDESFHMRWACMGGAFNFD